MGAAKALPEPYDFLYTAGTISRADQSSPEGRRCAKTLRAISDLNGSFKLLDADFRADLYRILSCRCETKAKLMLAVLAARCEEPALVPDSRRQRTREILIGFSHHWPEHPASILPPHH